MRNEDTTKAISTILRAAFSVAAIVACLSTQSWCTDRKGTYDRDCSGHTFHFLPPRGGPADELILRLRWQGPLWPPAWVSADRHEVIAKKCSSKSEECENAVKGTMQFDEIGKHISGSFDVEFANEHEQGKFKAKYRHSGPRIICE
jgi:hypothetical protein